MVLYQVNGIIDRQSAAVGTFSWLPRWLHRQIYRMQLNSIKLSSLCYNPQFICSLAIGEGETKSIDWLYKKFFELNIYFLVYFLKLDLKPFYLSYEVFSNID